jgi:tetratricopeptide (TPR) repeat protein
MRPGQTSRIGRCTEGERRSLRDSRCAPQKPQPSSFREPQDSPSWLTQELWGTARPAWTGRPRTDCSPSGGSVQRFAFHGSATSSVVRAFQLWDRGQPKAAIAILEPLLKAGFRFDDARDAGVAWNVLGHAYLDSDRYAEAMQAYQHSMEILRPIASARAQYGTTLDSMGILEASLGQLNEAKTLCEKARQI